MAIVPNEGTGKLRFDFFLRGTIRSYFLVFRWLFNLSNSEFFDFFPLEEVVFCLIWLINPELKHADLLVGLEGFFRLLLICCFSIIAAIFVISTEKAIGISDKAAYGSIYYNEYEGDKADNFGDFNSSCIKAVCL